MLEHRRRGRSVNFLTSEGIVGTQNEAEDTGGPRVDTDTGVPGEDAATKGRRKRDTFKRAIRNALGTCAAPVALRPRRCLTKTRPEDAGETGPLLEKAEDEQPAVASGNAQAA
jgi:hypothetical protein